MKRIGCLIVFFAFIQSGFAQDLTFKNRGVNMSTVDEKVLIIPFEDRMFISDINKEVANRTGLSIDEIKATFRTGLVQTLSQMGADYGDYIDPYEWEEKDQEDLWRKVYSRANYDFNEVTELKKVKEKGLLDKLEWKEEESQVGRGTYVEEGQLKSWYDKKERFAQARLKPEVIAQLIEEHDLDYLLFLTELDIQVMRDFNRDVGQTWPRRVKVHFTLYDKKGEMIKGSAAYNYYEGEQKDIYTIIRKSFDFPCAQIVTTIHNLDQEETMADEKTDSEDEENGETEEEKPTLGAKLKDRIPRFTRDDSDEDF